MTQCPQLSQDVELAFVASVMHNIDLASDFHIEAGRDGGRIFVEIVCYRPDVMTGEWGYGHGGKRYLPGMPTRDTVVKTIFGAYLAYVEHEARETFKYKGKRIFGPHIAIDALASVADQIV
jgi:hypothetical protein